MRRNIFFVRTVFILIVLALSSTGCFSEPEARLGDRLERFISLLDTQERDLLKSGKYDQVAALLKTRLAASKDLEKEYQDILHDENIAYFDTGRVLRFFDGSMRARAKLFRFVAMLEKNEVLAFNQKQYSDVASSLNGRFSDDPALYEEYNNRIAPGLPRQDDKLLAHDYVIDTIVLPFAQLYAVMNAGERELLAGDESPKASRMLAARLATEPAVQSALTTIRMQISRTKDMDVPAMVFDAASVAEITNRGARLALVRMADWLITSTLAGTRPAERDAVRTAFPDQLDIVTGFLPPLDAGTKRQMLLKRDIDWFARVVDEKIDFYTENSGRRE